MQSLTQVLKKTFGSALLYFTMNAPQIYVLAEMYFLATTNIMFWSSDWSFIPYHMQLPCRSYSPTTVMLKRLFFDMWNWIVFCVETVKYLVSLCFLAIFFWIYWGAFLCKSHLTSCRLLFHQNVLITWVVLPNLWIGRYITWTECSYIWLAKIWCSLLELWLWRGAAEPSCQVRSVAAGTLSQSP